MVKTQVMVNLGTNARHNKIFGIIFTMCFVHLGLAIIISHVSKTGKYNSECISLFSVIGGLLFFAKCDTVKLLLLLNIIFYFCCQTLSHLTGHVFNERAQLPSYFVKRTRSFDYTRLCISLFFSIIFRM